jgi:hypothetical protein
MMAIWKRRPPKGLMAHSDRGSQYASDLYQKTIKDHRFICSMSRKGNCWEGEAYPRGAMRFLRVSSMCSITARDATQLSAIKCHWAMRNRVEKLRDYLSGKVLPYQLLNARNFDSIFMKIR